MPTWPNDDQFLSLLIECTSSLLHSSSILFLITSSFCLISRPQFPYDYSHPLDYYNFMKVPWYFTLLANLILTILSLLLDNLIYHTSFSLPASSPLYCKFDCPLVLLGYAL